LGASHSGEREPGSWVGDAALVMDNFE